LAMATSDVGRQGDPHLRLHGVLGGTVKGLDPEVLFDPTKEQLHLPTHPIELGDDQGKQGKIVGQEGEPGLFLGVEVHDAAQGVGIALRRADAGEANGLVATHAAGVIDRARGAQVELQVLFGARDKKRASLREQIETGEVHITAVEQIKRSRFQQHLVEKIDIVDLPAGHINTGGNAAAHIQERMQLDRTFVTAKLSPRKQRQAQIDGGRVEGIHGLGQVHAERFVAVKIPRPVDQHLCEVAINAPVANLVGMRQRVARNLPPETDVVKFGLLGAKASFDIAQAAAIGELSKQEAKELIPTREVFDVTIALIAIDTKLKLVSREEIQELRENTAAKIHGLPPARAGLQPNHAKKAAEN